MSAVIRPMCNTMTPATRNQGGSWTGWLGTGCRLALVPAVVVLHLPMVIAFGMIVIAGAVVRRR